MIDFKNSNPKNQKNLYIEMVRDGTLREYSNCSYFNKRKQKQSDIIHHRTNHSKRFESHTLPHPIPPFIVEPVAARPLELIPQVQRDFHIQGLPV